MRKIIFIVFLLPVVLLQAQISGTVVDETGQPLIGAAVRVVGSNQGTITDYDGVFILPDAPADATIEVSYVGYLPQRHLIIQNSKFNYFPMCRTLKK